MGGAWVISKLFVLTMLVASATVPQVVSSEAPLPQSEPSLQPPCYINCDEEDDDTGPPCYVNCDEDDQGAPRFEYPVDEDDDSCIGFRCDDDDDGFGVGTDDCRGLYCEDDDEDNEGAPRLEITPYPAPNECSTTTNTHIRVPSGGNVRFDELDCQDDPWNSSTDGCLSFGSICDDESYLVECSYVTASSFGLAEGACDVPIGQNQMENCFPVSGSPGVSANLASSTQTFRCLENGTISDGGYSIDDIGPWGNNFVLLLCSSESAMLGGPNEDTCENPPRGVSYYSCEVDNRFPVPMGSDGDWYLCTS